MCRLFIGADARLWRTRLKSVRMRGYSTSVRLENFYWRVLEDIARRDGMAVPQLLAKLHEELIEAHGEIDNFSSFLRVCCGRYLSLQLAGDVPRDPAGRSATSTPSAFSARGGAAGRGAKPRSPRADDDRIGAGGRGLTLARLRPLLRPAAPARRLFLRLRAKRRVDGKLIRF